MPKPGELQYPNALDTAKTLVEAANDAATTLTAPLGISDITAQVASAAKFPNSGFVVIGSEILTFDGKTATTLLNLTRGEQGTTAAGHNSGDAVEQLITARDHNVLADAIRALESKVGSAASTPAASKVLRGTGAGTSAWADETYQHHQAVLASTWTITHNLGRFPGVTVVNSDGEEVEAEIDYISANAIEV